MINDNSILVPVKNLIEKNGSIANDLVLNRLSLGGNNQTFKVSTDHAHYIAKKYYIHENDQRDRLLSEFSFLTFANQEAPNYVPDIYGKDINERIALYQFIPGKDFKDQKIVERHIESAIDFFRCINRDRKKGLSLPVASEACFSLFEHMRIIERRLQQIESILPVNEFASQALIIAKDLKVCWEIFCKVFCQNCH